MKYMLLIYGSQIAWDALNAADVDQLAQAHSDIKAELSETGELVASSELETEEAQVVRQNEGGVVIENGPFTEGQQVIGGYYIVDCLDANRASEIASKFAELKFAPIEVRRMGDSSTWVELQQNR